VAQFADERSRAIRVQFTEGEVKVFSSSVEMGESEETVTSEYKGPDLESVQCAVPAGFPAGDGTGPHRFELKDQKALVNCGQRRCDAGPIRYVVMPMRI